MEIISDSIRKFFETVAGYVPQLLLACVVLVLGWLGAKLLSKVVHQILLTGDLDLRLARWLNIEPLLGESEKPRRRLAKGIEIFTYYFSLLVVLIVFFEVLGDTTITNILEGILSEISRTIPAILKGVAILVVAWIVGLVLKYATIRALKTARLGERLSKALQTPEEGAAVPGRDISESLGNLLFYLVLLFALPGVLEAFNLTSLMKPFQDMYGEALKFLPSILMALLILIFGYLLARLCERLVANISTVMGINRFVDSLSFDSVLKSLDLGKILGTLAFVVVMVPVLALTFETLKLPMITSVFTGMMNQVASAIPLILGAFILVILGLIIGRFLGDLTGQVLHNAGFDVLLGRIGLQRWEKGEDEDKGILLSKVAGNVVNAVIVLFLAMEGFRLMNLPLIAQAIDRLLLFLPNVLIAFVILGLGFYLAGVVQEMVRRSFAAERSIEAGTVGLVLRYAVIVFAFFMAFDQLGIAHSIVVNAFIILLGTVGLALALAFGLGSKDQAAQYVRHLLERGREKTDKPLE